ncbi:hypothetical protein [Streptomyces sp. cmx-4-9]|uniref:hypothetical protein n=1 Tax=Streptomyces sp. cmx-4-9 TaxID=2790941 RepID=UPI0039818D51
MSGEPWPARLSPRTAKAVVELPEHAKELLRDVLDVAARSPWGFAQWDTTDPEGEDVRAASVGRLGVVYFVNRSRRRLSVLEVVWLG